MTPLFFKTSVTVVGGIGSAQFWVDKNYPVDGLAHGGSANLTVVAVATPSGGDPPAYDWLIVDTDGFAVAGKSNIVGNVTGYETALIYPNGYVQILNATRDGSYNVKVYAVANN